MIFLIKNRMLFFLIPTLGTLFCITFFGSCAAIDNQNNSQIRITVNFINDTSKTYTILPNSHQNYTITQEFSWKYNNSTRFNLQSYSIDNGPFVAIHRNAYGNFTIKFFTDSNHSIVFLAKPQFKIITSNTNKLDFSPPSPTNDDWFDIDSNIQIIAPTVSKMGSNNTRQQLSGWSIDGSDMYVIPRQESSYFKSPVIHMSTTHTIDLEYKTQYYIQVISDFGRALGTGWYDAGTILDISVIPNDDVLVKHEFSGWQGPVIGSGDQESANVLSDSPKILVASWFVDYTNVSIITIVAIALLVFMIIYQKKRIVQA